MGLCSTRLEPNSVVRRRILRTCSAAMEAATSSGVRVEPPGLPLRISGVASPVAAAMRAGGCRS